MYALQGDRMIIKATPVALLDPPAVFLHYKDADVGCAGFWAARNVIWQQGEKGPKGPRHTS